MATSERVRRSIEFQYGVDAEDLIRGTQIAENSVAGLQAKLEQLKAEFEGAEIGSAEFNRLGNEIQQTSSKLKTLDERFEGLGIEQKNAMIVDSFNVVVGAVGAVTGALVAFGVESKALDGVEKRLLGIITVVSSLREVSNGLAAFNKIWPALAANISTATAALRAFALANPFTAIIVGITAATAALFAFNKLQKESNEDAEKAIELRKKQEELAKNDRQNYINLVKEYARVGETELETAQRVFDTIQKKYKEADRTYQFLKVNEKNSLKTQEQALEVDRLGVKFNEARLRLQIAQKRAQIDADKQAIEDNKKVADEAIKNAERIAIAAAKQLEARQKADQLLIELYEQFPEFIGEGAKGQFEFNTELDKTNFALQEQLDILFTLKTEYEDLGEVLEEIDFEDSVSFFSREQLDVFKKLRDSNKTELQIQLEDLRETYLEDLTLFSDNEEVKTQLTEQYEKDRADLRRQYAIQTSQQVLGITSNFLNTIADINQQSLELQLLQAAGNQAAIDRINAEALEKQKKLRIAQTLITTAESILNGFNATSTLPPPFNFIAGAALAAAYTALGAKTIQTISATTLEGGGNTGGGFNNIPSGGGGFSLPGGGGVSTAPSLGAVLPGLGGGRIAGAPTIGTATQEPIRAYVLAGDVSNGVQANVALNTRRRLAGG
jgi:hypothetical protein